MYTSRFCVHRLAKHCLTCLFFYGRPSQVIALFKHTFANRVGKNVLDESLILAAACCLPTYDESAHDGSDRGTLVRAYSANNPTCIESLPSRMLFLPVVATAALSPGMS